MNEVLVSFVVLIGALIIVMFFSTLHVCIIEMIKNYLKNKRNADRSESKDESLGESEDKEKN